MGSIVSSYIKQYGEIRTGTNYLKRLIELNFIDVHVFGSILGWKHGMYDLSNTRDGTNSHEEWVKKKTRKGVVFSVDGYPLRYSPKALLEAIPGLGYIFSIKKPIPYVLSYKKFRFPNKKLTPAIVKNMCQRYNKSYYNWLELYRQNEAVSIIVPYESLIRDINHVLLNLDIRFDMNKRLPEASYTDETCPVNASTDVGLLVDKKTQFNKKYYLEEEYLSDVTDEVISVIDDHIDQSLVDTLYKLGL